LPIMDVMDLVNLNWEEISPVEADNTSRDMAFRTSLLPQVTFHNRNSLRWKNIIGKTIVYSIALH